MKGNINGDYVRLIQVDVKNQLGCIVTYGGELIWMHIKQLRVMDDNYKIDKRNHYNQGAF